MAAQGHDLIREGTYRSARGPDLRRAHEYEHDNGPAQEQNGENKV